MLRTTWMRIKGFEVWGSGFRVEIVRFGVQGLEFKFEVKCVGCRM